MELSPYVAALRENLIAAAAAGDEQTRTTASVLAATIEPAARLALMNALSDLAAEVTLALGDRVVEVRLDGQDVRVVVTGTPDDEPEPEPEPQLGDATGDISRITVRLLEELKTKAEQAASARGVSLNSFVSQAVQGALQDRGRRRGGGGPFGGNQWSGPWGAGQWGGQDWGQWGFGNPGHHGGHGGPGGSGGQESRPSGDEGGHGPNRVQGWVEG